MVAFRIKLRTDDVIEVRMLEQGGYICPICGSVLNDAPYVPVEDVSDFVSLKEPVLGGASFNVCPTCHVEYGNDDYDDNLPVSAMWDVLRRRWLEKVGWSPDALRALRENLGVTPK